MSQAYIGIGSNVGEPRENVERAIEELSRIGKVRARSSLYRTAPWGNTDQPSFINAVVDLETDLAPHALLESLKGLESEFGRNPRAPLWGPRVIDLDILTYDDLEVQEPHLTIPHARLRDRAFVLVPLSELDDRFADSCEALSTHDLSGVTKV